MTNYYTETITIFNVIPPNIEADPPTSEQYLRTVLRNCSVQSKNAQKRSTFISDVYTKSFYIKDFANYLPPTTQEGGFYALPDAEKPNYYTVAPGDFIIKGEITDVVTSASELSALEVKYKAEGVIISETSAFLYGVKTDHIYASG